MQACLFIVVLNRVRSLRPISLKKNKNHFILKKHQKIVQFPGLWEPLIKVLASTVFVMLPILGKRRGVLLVKHRGTCRMVGGRTPEMLSDEAKTRAGNQDTSPAPGVMM
ncbi:hypothetical protein NG42_06025 [Winslowiella iniecta]|uniref:Uncharacterized protein n=1 Tax=Winslowiella iniecta TaxID=1560201 RepID=A0A0L7SY03_9GAMM|nr:hypothetical protein NG43_20920 [Winslowiella iniecta]KOC91391.1 hypothetical protein NG42_06025 [Winslowiella iniecta]